MTIIANRSISPCPTRRAPFQPDQVDPHMGAVEQRAGQPPARDRRHDVARNLVRAAQRCRSRSCADHVDQDEEHGQPPAPRQAISATRRLARRSAPSSVASHHAAVLSSRPGRSRRRSCRRVSFQRVAHSSPARAGPVGQHLVRQRFAGMSPCRPRSPRPASSTPVARCAVTARPSGRRCRCQDRPPPRPMPALQPFFTAAFSSVCFSGDSPS